MNQPTHLSETIASHTFRLCHVPGGAFDMGSNDEDAFSWEKPVHKVQVPDFCLAEFPVTQALWKAVMGADHNPSYFKGDRRPVETVSWNDAQAFIAALNAHPDKKTPGQYRLPTEAEWEYAARYAPDGAALRYAGSNLLSEVGWYGENSHGETKPVGLKAPNALGLYDLSGNVWEWCEDDWHDSYKGAPSDGSAWVDAGERGRDRVQRGGCWFNGAQFCRTASRYDDRPAFRVNLIGFRLALSLQSVGQPIQDL